MDAAVIENEALKLPERDRAVLADHLLQSIGHLDDRIMQEWVEEGERRLASFLKGEIAALDGESVVRAIKKKFA